MNNNKLILLVVVMLLLVAGGYFLVTASNKNSQENIVVMEKTEEVTTSGEEMEKAVEDTMEKTAVKTFEVAGGGGFYFNPSEIKVIEGDTVKIVFKNEGGVHDWVIDEFNARTPVIQANETAEVEFVANKAGTFEYYCSVGNHRQQGMVGNLIVEAKQ